MTAPVLVARGVAKTYRQGKLDVPALRGVDLEVREGEFLALVGPSGSGKTTLLNLIGALDVPTDGELLVLGQRMADLSRRQRADLRLRSIGFVFQAYNLVPVLTALENVEFVLELQGLGAERRTRALEVLADEPTANLDGENAEVLMHLMRDLRDRHGMTFLFSTHDPRVVAHAVRVVTLVEGRVARDVARPGEAPHEILPGVGKPPEAGGR